MIGSVDAIIESYECKIKALEWIVKSQELEIEELHNSQTKSKSVQKTEIVFDYNSKPRELEVKVLLNRSDFDIFFEPAKNGRYKENILSLSFEPDDTDNYVDRGDFIECTAKIVGSNTAGYSDSYCVLARHISNPYLKTPGVRPNGNDGIYVVALDGNVVARSGDTLCISIIKEVDTYKKTSKKDYMAYNAIMRESGKLNEKYPETIYMGLEL